MRDPTLDERSTSALAKEAVDEARDLVRAEVALAKDELRTEAKSAALSMLALLMALMIAAFAVAGLVAAILLLAGATVGLAALIFAGVMAALAVAAGGVAYRLVPKQILVRTRDRIEEDIRDVKDRLQ